MDRGPVFSCLLFVVFVVVVIAVNSGQFKRDEFMRLLYWRRRRGREERWLLLLAEE